MSQPCAIPTCQQTSRVLCHCCNKNLCLDHLSNHQNYQSNSLVDQINPLDEQLKRLDMNKLSGDTRQKLDKWHEESLKKLNQFYEKKCEELDRYNAQKIDELQEEIHQVRTKATDYSAQQDTDILQTTIRHIKQKIDIIEQKSIQIRIRPLSIDHSLISIIELKTQEFDLTTLSSPYQTLHCSGSALACNDQFLLIDQNPELNLFNRSLTIVQQSLWKYNTIRDMCWSSILASFILITENNQAFLVNENNSSIDSIGEMKNQLWMSCTCSNSLLYLASFSSSIVEFSLLPTFSSTRRWDPPITCKKNEYIRDIDCNNDTIALIVVSDSDKMVHLILRSLLTFDILFSIRLDIKHSIYNLPIRCCSLKDHGWLVIDANTSRFFHISNDGKVKGTLKYDNRPHNAVLFGSNILVIRTDTTLNFHQLFC